MADPSRFHRTPRVTGSLLLVVAGCMALTVLLVATPRRPPSLAVSSIVAGAWVALLLAMTLPSRAQRAGEELAVRLARFRHAVNTVGDHPTRAQLEDLMALAHHLQLRDEEVDEEITRLRAALAALTLRDEIKTGTLPVVSSVGPLAPGDMCHFRAAVRFGRRRSDQFGHLLLTSGWMKYRGTVEVSTAWSEVASVERAGIDVIVALQNSRRLLRFCFKDVEEAARAGVIAEHLALSARADADASDTGDGPAYHAPA
ncbi:MAG TPA: hypothetical protein VL173_15880 [Vicinamibacterales bacterium]|jgi:hypothetical protein|nr:hypothetical protein [Vicinamibacterales bacterium]